MTTLTTLDKLDVGPEIVRALRKHTDAMFRVDANCGWTAEQTIEYAPQLKALGVEFIEQPLKADRWDDLRRVRAESVLPIIADESCIAESDVARCHGVFHGINIKLTKCGGVGPALAMMRRAREPGFRVMLGCMEETSVGIAAAAALAGLADWVDLDGNLLLARDPFEGLVLGDDRRWVLSGEPGLGVRRRTDD